MEGFAAWIAACATEQDLQAGRGAWIQWAQEMGWSVGGPGQPPRSPEIIQMQQLFVAKANEFKKAKGGK